MAPLTDDKIAPFFDGNEPTEASKQALAFCNQFQIDFNATRAMIDKIDAHGLFAPRQSKVTLEGGEMLNLTDFQVIDEPAFNKLSDEAFLDLQEIRRARPALLPPRLDQQLDLAGLPGVVAASWLKRPATNSFGKARLFKSTARALA